jgi:hypothetical protein
MFRLIESCPKKCYFSSLLHNIEKPLSAQETTLNMKYKIALAVNFLLDFKLEFLDFYKAVFH